MRNIRIAILLLVTVLPLVAFSKVSCDRYVNRSVMAEHLSRFLAPKVSWDTRFSFDSKFIFSLETPLGQMAYQRALQAGMINTGLKKYYQPQRYLTSCSIASFLVIMKSWGFTGGRDPMFKAADSLKPITTLVSRSPNAGMHLSELDTLIDLFMKRKVQGWHSYARENPSEIEVSNFRKDIIRSLREDDLNLILNYHGRTLGTNTGGHFSPIAAYDAKLDMVLVLDVAQHKNPPFWAPVEKVYEAMAVKDSASGLPRGWILVQYN